ncbi:MAG: 50S ribosomal protein L22 [Clostridia bacterium]|nr:50S ribosomal protein L22 [Clostridia bacterium]
MAKRVRTKAENRALNADKRPRAIAKYVRISPDKVRIVLDIIRGKSYVEAVAILKNTRKAACEPLLKLVNSAAANAENNLNMNKNDLYVAECFANGGPILKRVQPRAQGRAFRINKRTSHITVILDTVTE